MKMTNKNRMRGVTLIELMIAMVIGLMLLAGAAMMFISNKNIYRDINDMGELQENGRFALELLIQNIRNAGYPGCSDDMSLVINNLNNSSNVADLLNFTNAVEGSENTADWAPSGNDTDVVDDMVAGTDALTIRYLSPIYINQVPTTLTADMSVPGSAPTVNDTSGLQANELLSISDCDGADIFQLSGIAGSTLQHTAAAAGDYPDPPNNADANFSRIYPQDSLITRYIVRRYYIGSDANGSALFHQTPSGTQVLVEGVQNMQILYGEDTSSDSVADTYVNAAGVTNWDNVINVKLALLIQATQINGNLDPDTNTYNLLGTNVGPFNDTRRRRIFSATIQIRNRAITG